MSIVLAVVTAALAAMSMHLSHARLRLLMEGVTRSTGARRGANSPFSAAFAGALWLASSALTGLIGMSGAHSVRMAVIYALLGLLVAWSACTWLAALASTSLSPSGMCEWLWHQRPALPLALSGVACVGVGLAISQSEPSLGAYLYVMAALAPIPPSVGLVLQHRRDYRAAATVEGLLMGWLRIQPEALRACGLSVAADGTITLRTPPSIVTSRNQYAAQLPLAMPEYEIGRIDHEWVVLHPVTTQTVLHRQAIDASGGLFGALVDEQSREIGAQPHVEATQQQPSGGWIVGER